MSGSNVLTILGLLVGGALSIVGIGSLIASCRSNADVIPLGMMPVVAFVLVLGLTMFTTSCDSFMLSDLDESCVEHASQAYVAMDGRSHSRGRSLFIRKTCEKTAKEGAHHDE